MKIAEYISWYKSINKHYDEFGESIQELIDNAVKDSLKKKNVKAKVKAYRGEPHEGDPTVSWKSFIYDMDGKEDYVVYCRFDYEKFNFFVTGHWDTAISSNNIRTEEQLIDAVAKVVDSIPNINESTQTNRQKQLAGINE